MTKKKTTPSKPPAARPRQSVLREAWDNMTDDFQRLLPESLRQRPGKKKFVLWLFVVELLVLGVVGKFVYDWLAGP